MLPKLVGVAVFSAIAKKKKGGGGLRPRSWKVSSALPFLKKRGKKKKERKKPQVFDEPAGENSWRKEGGCLPDAAFSPGAYGAQ